MNHQLSWSETYDALVFTFKDSPRYRSQLIHSSFKEVTMADVMCALEFVRCVGVPGTSKGGPSALAWPMEITVHGTADSETSKIDWRKLPSTVQLVRIEHHHNHQREQQQHEQQQHAIVDLRRFINEIPGFVKTIEVVRSIVRIGGRDGHQQEIKKDDPSGGNDHGFLENLLLRECAVEDSFFAATKWLAAFSLKQLSIVECKFVSSSSLPPGESAAAAAAATAAAAVSSSSSSSTQSQLPKTIAALGTLEELHIVRNTGKPIVFDDLVDRIAAEHLTKLEIEFATDSDGDDPNGGGGGGGGHQQQSVTHKKKDTLLTSNNNNNPLIVAANDDKLSERVSTLTDLEELRISHVGVSQVPQKPPSSLRVLTMTFTNLRGPFPDLSSCCGSLEEVDFSYNALTEFPQREKLGKNLHHLRLAGNKIGGAIDFTRLSNNLVEVNLSMNALSGSADLTQLPEKMEVFDISHNKCSGPVNMREFPDSIRHLHINDNEFTGRYDVSRLPLLSVNIVFGNNKWDSLMPRRNSKKKKHNNNRG